MTLRYGGPGRAPPVGELDGTPGDAGFDPLPLGAVPVPGVDLEVGVDDGLQHYFNLVVIPDPPEYSDDAVEIFGVGVVLDHEVDDRLPGAMRVGGAVVPPAAGDVADDAAEHLGRLGKVEDELLPVVVQSVVVDKYERLALVQWWTRFINYHSSLQFSYQ